MRTIDERIILKKRELRDAVNWYGDTLEDPDLFDNKDRARAHGYVRGLFTDLITLLYERESHGS